MNTNCLTYEQLERYCGNNISTAERNKIYNHIFTCELCSCAVNGFTTAPFSINELVAINQTIDKKAKVNSLTFSQLIIAGVSIVSIIGFYLFVNSFDTKKTIVLTKPAIVSTINKTEPIHQAIRNFPATAITHTQHIDISEKETTVIIPELMKPIEIEEITSRENYYSKNNLRKTNNLSDFYLLNFKVVDYYKLYFSKAASQTQLIGYPSFIENKETNFDSSDKDESHSVTAISVLEQSFKNMNAANYEKALMGFNILLRHNANDINALFYSGLAYYKLGNYEKAIEQFEKVIGHLSTNFMEESNWNLALCYLKSGRETESIILLKEIEQANGFYAQQAKEKLTHIKP